MNTAGYDNEDQLDDGLPTADSFHNAEDSDDEVTDFVRENLRRYSLDSNFDKKKKSHRPSFSFFTHDRKEKIRRNILKGKPKKTLTIVEEEKTIHELELETRNFQNQSNDFESAKMPEHEWVPCSFKNATFCMICGKLTSQLGEIPLTAEKQVPTYVYRQGPNVNREGLRCQVCLMSIHDICLERAKDVKIAIGCTGRPDPRSGAGHFVREGIGNFNFSRHLSICDTLNKSALQRDSLTSIDPLDQIDESYQILKQGKALRLVQTGEDVREGKSAKKSIADPVFWKSLFMKRGSIAPEGGLGARPKKGLFGGILGSRHLKIPKTVDKVPYCALYQFDAREKHDITLRPGDKIYVFDSKDDNWWFGKKEPQGTVGYFPAKFVMKIEETEKPFLVIKHCFGNSRRKELKAKENTIVVVNYAQPIQREDCLFVRSLDGEGFVPKDVIKPI